jgi:type IV pilus assembly protein PilM
MSKVLNIEIGRILTRMCEVDYKKNHNHVENNCVFETPPGLVNDGQIDQPGDMADTLLHYVSEQQIKIKRVMFTISSTRIVTREVVLPYVSKDKIINMLQANAADYLPVKVQDYHLTYKLLDVFTDESKVKRMKLLFLAVPLGLLEGYYDLAKFMNMSLECIEYTGNSIIEMINQIKPEGVALSIHMGEAGSVVTVFKDGVMDLQRHVSAGAMLAVDAMQEFEDVSDDDFNRMETLQKLIRDDVVNTVLPSEDDIAEANEKYNQVRDDFTRRAFQKVYITRAFAHYLGQLLRIIDYYRSKNPDVVLDSVYLSGIGTEIKGIDGLIEFELGIKTRKINSLPKVEFTRYSELNSFAAMVLLICGAMRPTNLMSDYFQKKKVHRTSMALPISVAIIGAVTAAGLIIYGNFRERAAQNRFDELTIEADSLKPIEVVIQKEADYKDVRDAMVMLKEYTQNPNQYFVDFMEELEHNMPSDIRIQDMTISANGFTMNMTTSDWTSAAEVLAQLRQSKYLQSGVTYNIKEEDDTLQKRRFEVYEDDELIATMAESEFEEWVKEYKGSGTISTREVQEETKKKIYTFNVSGMYKTMQEIENAK